MRQKGQVSIEFMLVLIILLIYIQTMILPTITVSLRSVEDVARVGQTSFAAHKLGNAIQNIQMISGDAKQQISLYLPACGTTSCTVSCSGTSISFSAPLNSDLSPITACPGNTCNKTFYVSGSATCNFALAGPASRLVTLEKRSGTVNVTLS